VVVYILIEISFIIIKASLVGNLFQVF
jgi:hypothetical protein